MQNHETVLTIFIVVTALGVLLQAGVLLGMFIAVLRGLKEARELSDQLKQHLVPALSITRNLIEELAPKVKVATSNLVETTQVLRTQVEHINKTMNEIEDLAQAQVARVDEMATAVLEGITQATAAVQHGIATPLKQVSGVLNGLRAGFDVLRKKERPAHVEADGSNFV